MEDASFHNKVRRLLDEQGKSQAILAENLKVSPSHLSRALKGERPAERLLLEEIAGFFDLSLDELVAGTEHEDMAVPGRGSVERETYEQLLERLREAMSAAEVCDANLAGEREKTAQLEERLASTIDEARGATARVAELEQELGRSARDRREQAGRIKGLEAQVDEFTCAKASLDARLEQVEGQLRSETRARSRAHGRERAPSDPGRGDRA